MIRLRQLAQRCSCKQSRNHELDNPRNGPRLKRVSHGARTVVVCVGVFVSIVGKAVAVTAPCVVTRHSYTERRCMIRLRQYASAL